MLVRVPAFADDGLHCIFEGGEGALAHSKTRATLPFRFPSGSRAGERNRRGRGLGRKREIDDRQDPGGGYKGYRVI